MLYKWLSPQPDEGDCVGESHSVRMLPIVGGSSDLHQLYSPVDSRLDAQYNPQYFKLRPRRETNRQPEAGHGGGRLYHLVHPGVHSSVKFFLNMLPIAHSVLGLQGQHKSVTF